MQAPPSADPILFPPGGLAGLFNNPTYQTTFATFSAARLFSVIGGRVTDVTFFVPGGGNVPATVSALAPSYRRDQPNGAVRQETR